MMKSITINLIIALILAGCSTGKEDRIAGDENDKTKAIAEVPIKKNVSESDNQEKTMYPILSSYIESLDPNWYGGHTTGT